MPRINHLKINKLGNVAPGTELKFGAKGAVLLGKNGTGKTTLLNILTDICTCNLASLSDGDFDVEFSISCINNVQLNTRASCTTEISNPSPKSASDPVINAMRVALQERPSRQTLRIEALHPDSGERVLFESDNNGTLCTLSNGNKTTATTPASQGWRILRLNTFTDDQKNQFTDAFIELFLLRTTLRRFDEGLDYFRALTESGRNSIHIESSKRPNEIHLVNYIESKLISQGCAQLLIDAFYKHGDNLNFGLAHASAVDYLKLFCDLTDFHDASLYAFLDEKRHLDDREIVSLSPLHFSVMRNGTTLHHRHLSFGQQRLLAFLHYHDSTPSLLMADELVNGMHHEWISQCMNVMQNSQAFLSSQNPLLFDFLTFESVEDVATRFVSCDLDEQHRFVWRNMSESDAFEFYETYKVGLQYVSEILRTRGYW